VPSSSSDTPSTRPHGLGTSYAITLENSLALTLRGEPLGRSRPPRVAHSHQPRQPAPSGRLSAFWKYYRPSARGGRIRCRRRDRHRCLPPAQIRTGGFPAYGSSIRW